MSYTTKSNISLCFNNDKAFIYRLIEIDEDIIFVTSSLYEIEIQDYTESTLFKFNKKGELIKSINFEEKPWFMKKHNGKIVLGIGRPRCGFLTIDNENLV